MKVQFCVSPPSDCSVAMAVGSATESIDALITPLGDECRRVVSRGLAHAKFSGKPGQTVDILAPEGSAVESIIVAAEGHGDTSRLRLQRGIAAALKHSNGYDVLILANGLNATDAAAIGQAVILANYKFNHYKTKESADAEQENSCNDSPMLIYVLCDDPSGAERLFDSLAGETAGVQLARDLVCEPANILSTTEFVRRIEELRDIGIEVEILDKIALEEVGAGAMLAVANGSDSPAAMAIMRWNGSPSESIFAILGKGVVFDSGGISIKPASKMDEMKGDMAGAAAVVGLMKTLAMSKARTNVVGCVGLVENMLSGRSMRPGDVVTSLSGQTIEIANTDAEGRLVLADLVTYVQRKYSPDAIVDLATLTGACMVALGKVRAGLFCNDEGLASTLCKAGEQTGELLWQLPIDEEYDKLISSKIADVRNIGKDGYGGAITAAKFIQRFVDDTIPWAHLDIAGVAFAHSPSPLDPGWASGFGVRLLNNWLTSIEQV